MQWSPPPERVALEIDMPSPRPFALDPARTALVIVDMQNAWLKSPERVIAKFSGIRRLTLAQFERYAATIAGNRTLLEKARVAGAPVIHVQSVRRHDTLEVVRYGQPLIIREDSWEAEIIEELAPLPEEPVAQKWSHDPWAATSLAKILAERGIVANEWSILVTGVSAAVCAHACTLGFLNRHYMTLVPMDCTAAASIDEEARIYAQYLGASYCYNVAFTTSDLVRFAAGAPPPEEQHRAGSPVSLPAPT